MSCPVVENSCFIYEYFPRLLISFCETTKPSQLFHCGWNSKNLILTWISIFMMINYLENLFFNMSMGYLCILFYEVLIKLFPIYLSVTLSFKYWFLGLIFILKLRVVCCKHIFSQPMTYFLLSFILSLDEKNLLVLLKIHWFLFFFSVSISCSLQGVFNNLRS